MNLDLDNFLSFNKFNINFSYPRKVKNNSLNGEYLNDFPHFRYRKLNLILGSNSSGKTSLGRIINAVFEFIRIRNPLSILSLADDESKPANFSMDIVFDKDENKVANDACMWRLKGSVSKNEEQLNFFYEKLRPSDTYEKVVKRIKKQMGMDKSVRNSISDIANPFEGLAGLFSFPMNEPGYDQVKCAFSEEKQDRYKHILETILKTMDTSIKDVQKTPDVKDSYFINFYNGKQVVFQDGDLYSKIKLLSSGTKYSFNIANAIMNIIYRKHSFSYLDEQFTYVDSDIEEVLISVMTNLLKDCSQLIITSHNKDLLNMNLPTHSFGFLKKDVVEGKSYTEYINASDYVKKNTQSLFQSYQNDLFQATPSTDLLRSLAEAKKE